MERPIAYQFETPALETNITGNIPDWCTYRIPYAEARQIDVEQGTVVRQFYSHILFFMEVIEVDLHEDLHASYLIENPNLFLFLVLQGRMTFLTPDGKLIAEAPENICYATYNKKGEYLYRLPKGKHLFCYLCPRAIWIIKHLNRYPRLKPFMERMENSDDLFGHMPPFWIDNDMKKSLEQLFRDKETGGVDLESLLSDHAKKVIDDYQRLLDVKFSQREYQIRDYLDANFADPALSNYSIAGEFHITEKTLIEIFKDEFNTTPHNYLIQVRMKHAKRMLTEEKKPINEVYGKVGYRDLHSFSAQFKKTFKNTPLDYLKGRFLSFFWSF